MTKKKRASHSLAGCSWFCCRLLDRLSVCSMLIGQSWFQQIPQWRLWVPTWTQLGNFHSNHYIHNPMIIPKEMRWASPTKLLIDDGHIRNSLVTVVITHAVEFFRAYIDCRFLERRFTAYLCINLSKSKQTTSYLSSASNKSKRKLKFKTKNASPSPRSSFRRAASLLLHCWDCPHWRFGHWP